MSHDIYYNQKHSGIYKYVATPSPPQAVDVVNVSSLLRIIIIVVVDTLVFIDLYCSTKVLP